MVRTWDEAEHPRDEEGRFTFKNGVGSTKKEDYFQGKNIQLFDTKDYVNGKRRLGAIGLGFTSNPKIVTGGAAEIVTDNIVGVQKGEPMSIDDALKGTNNELKFYDPQINKIYNCEILSRIKYKFDWGEEPIPPMILRVDDKELNKKVFNQISKPSKTLNNN